MFLCIQQVRVIFYFLSVVLEDEETQKKGIVVVTSTRVSFILFSLVLLFLFAC